MRSFLAAFGLVALFVACSSTPAKKTTLCTPNKASYCRCQDREQGEKTCAKDGQSFGPCEPCETIDNPEGPLLPGDPGIDDPYPKGDDDDDVDAGGKDSGPTTTARCGDGTVQKGEDCDDANAANDDGCDDKCKLAGTKPDSSQTCPGLAVDIWGGEHRPTLTLTTDGAGDRKSKDLCAASGSTAVNGAGAPDRVFHVTAHANGTMNVAVTNADFNTYVYVASDCDPATETATKCVNKVNAVGDETLVFGATAEKTYSVFVDGADGAKGNFKITFAIQ